MKQENEHIDHIILGINNLEKGIEQFEALTGVKPVMGGIHPYSFTHNALVALDHNRYVEIMAPRPDAENIPAEFLSLNILTPIDWAVRTHAINKTREKLKAAGFNATENKDGSRAKPDGTLLSWTTFGIDHHADFPFFIEWGKDSVHPSASSPAGCMLQSFQIIVPDTEAMNKLNNALSLGIQISQGNEARLQLILNTPKGKVIF